ASARRSGSGPARTGLFQFVYVTFGMGGDGTAVRPRPLAGPERARCARVEGVERVSSAAGAASRVGRQVGAGTSGSRMSGLRTAPALAVQALSIARAVACG